MPTPSKHLRNYLQPLSWLYGLGVRVRNILFEQKILHEQSFRLPIICVGNLTVGGTGKTPHTEYLVNLLRKHFQVAVLSRGYRRKSRGLVIAHMDTPVEAIGDEPYQIKHKFPSCHVVVDTNRRRGIRLLQSDTVQPPTDVVVLDDAYQHRYVKAGINILLIDYHRPIFEDKLMPVGLLREHTSGISRAHIVIVTKCPNDLRPIDFRIFKNRLSLFPFQKLYFSTLRYGTPHGLFADTEHPLHTDDYVLIVTGIASPNPMIQEVGKHTTHITAISFGDHHDFTFKDILLINKRYQELPGTKKILLTTEKDATRLRATSGLDETILKNAYVLPIEVTFLRNGEDTFNTKIVSYVRKNSRNSVLAKKKNKPTANNSNHTGNRIRTTIERH